MGLFGSKQSKQSSTDSTAAAVQGVFDEQYRDELRELGRTRLKELIDQSADSLRQDIDNSVKQVTTDLKRYMSTQLDGIIASVNTEITNQLQERISEYSRLATDAQNQASQSLTRNSQTVYEKYQQLSATLQQTVSNQEVMMVTTFQDNKNRIATIEQEQYKVLAAMQETAESSRRELDEIHRTMAKTTFDQSQQLAQVYQENLSRVTSASEAHSAALQALQSSSQALQQQQQQMSAFLDKTVADQKALIMSAVNDNMASIVEHYVVSALGDQADLKTQIPSILARMEESKQEMMDDMSL